MEVHPITGHFGAEIHDIDLSQPLGPDLIAAIDRAFSDYKVLVFRDQGHVSPQSLLDLGEHFGTPDRDHHPTHAPVDGIDAVKRLVTDGRGFGGMVTDSWHTDASPRRHTDLTSFLQAVDVPPYGRDTMFADMEAAYDNLSPPLKTLLEGLVAVHSWGKARPHEPPVEHEVVFEDPRTGRKSIFVNKVYTRSIKGLRQDESDAILSFLFEQAHIPEHQLRATWKPGTIVAWDNQRTQHYIVQDMPYRRVMHRVMVYRRLSKEEAAAA
ncbi:MAG TPA: TauD/TfdA family dioxygenase [Allosphingosinicella sp.]|jgi:taurine dioxygenase|nr:TauD/TfdA family dioxygenase [Allosphingosinicella sp.]